MTRGTAVQITRSVLEWALEESGYDAETLASAIGVPAKEVRGWLSGDKLPNVTNLRAVANLLRRPLATFYLPSPPKQKKPPIEFRTPRGSGRAELNVTERHRIREAMRLQRILAWVVGELGREKPDLPRATTNNSPESQARAARERLAITFEQQQQWATPAAALQGWRRALERSGVFVLTLPMGEDSIRGFSLWDEAAPVIALNTSWMPEARTFTLFHEYAHLLTRTSSACVETLSRLPTGKSDPTERWCEEFAADVIIPRQALQEYLLAHGLKRPITDIKTVGRVAHAFRASLRATALRLIGIEAANWPLYKGLPAHGERRAEGGGGAGRQRAQIRLAQYGLHTIELFATALQKDVINRADVLDYLDIPPVSLGSTIAADEPYPE